MTREIIEAYRFIVIPYVVNKLKKFNYEGKGVSDAKEFMSDFNEIFDLAIKALEQEPRWIPVSEKYPKSEDEYKMFLVTDDKGVVSVQTFYMSIEKEPQPYFSGMVNVIAWMPLPKAYREVEE